MRRDRGELIIAKNPANLRGLFFITRHWEGIFPNQKDGDYPARCLVYRRTVVLSQELARRPGLLLVTL